MGKIKTLEEIKRKVAELRSKDRKIITTNGCFDLMHVGHIKFLQKAKRLGDILILGLNSDNSVKKFKGNKRPINDENSRAEILAAIDCIDYIVLFNEEDPRKLLLVIKPDVHVKGSDRKMSEIIEKDIVEKNGGKMTLLPIIKGYSTTNLIKKILKIYGNRQWSK